MAGDWMDDLVQKNKDRYASQRQNDQQFNRETALGGHFWRDLVAVLKSDIDTFNRKFGDNVFEVATCGADLLELSAEFTRQSRKTASVRYQASKHMVEWREEGTTPIRHPYELEFIGNTAVVAVSSGNQRTVQQLAREILEFLGN